MILDKNSKVCPRCGHDSFSNSELILLKEEKKDSSDDDRNHDYGNATIRDHTNLKKTIRGRQLENFNNNNEVTGSNCSNCGYPLEVMNSDCPKCEYVNHPEMSKKKTTKISNFEFEEEGLQIQLKPLKKDHKEFKFHLSDNNVILNRESFGDNDQSISASSHVSLSITDGKIFLENNSSNEAVFVKVSEKIELNDGDIILLGRNKHYKVKI